MTTSHMWLNKRLYIVNNVSTGNVFFNLFRTPMLHKILFDNLSTWANHFIDLSKVTPRKLNLSTHSIAVPCNETLGGWTAWWGEWNSVYLVLLIFKDNLFPSNQVLILENSLFRSISCWNWLIVCILLELTRCAGIVSI